MEKRTFNQTWVLCLRMWRWVSKMKVGGSKRWVSTLKRQWLRENGIKINGDHDCFFCEYINDANSCERCPGRRVNSDFNCFREAYHYSKKPVAFYRELLRLNRIRKKNEVT